jgi:hypothetical protein
VGNAHRILVVNKVFEGNARLLQISSGLCVMICFGVDSVELLSLLAVVLLAKK